MVSKREGSQEMKLVIPVVYLSMLVISSVQAYTPIYLNDFEGNSYSRPGVGIGWVSDGLWPAGSAFRTSTTPIGNRHFLGEYANASGSFLRIDISGLPENTMIGISLDLFVIGSWHYANSDWVIGGTWGGHGYKFSNQPGLPRDNAIEIDSLGYSTDSVYRIEQWFSGTADHGFFLIGGGCGQHDWSQDGSGKILESWGIDNMRIETYPTIPSVPEPSSLLALGGGLVGLIGVIRRKKVLYA